MTATLSQVMDAIASELEPVSQRVYAWPTANVAVPCVVVGYPTDIDFDITFVRGSDELIIPVYFMTGVASDRTARDELSAIITGARGIKDTLDGTLGDVVNSAYVTNCKIEEITIAGVAYISARFDIQVHT